MSESEELNGVVFNIQNYSIHDGPGIRTSVFIKECPLKCVWCQNPESQILTPQLFFFKDKCTGCGDCVPSCPKGAIQIVNGRSRTDRQLCTGTGICVKTCNHKARTLMGTTVTVAEVFRQVSVDRMFYERSGGGVTVSGGEPMSQPEFVASLLTMCKKAGIHTALDTCGYASWEQFQHVLDVVDLVMFDLKHMDPVEHQKYTGVSNKLILDNAKRIHHERSLPLLARLPVIPGHNDSLENMTATARFIAEDLDTTIHVHLLPYHRLGKIKNERLEKCGESATIDIPTDEDMLEHSRIFDSFGLKVHIGG